MPALFTTAFAWLARTLFGATLYAMPAILRRIAIALGIGAVTYVGFTQLIEFLTASITARFGLMGAVPLAAQVVGVMQIDQAVTNILSAMSIKLTMNLMGNLAGKKQIGLMY